MNIYEKLLKARLMLQQTDIKKSGHNKNLNFKYMELDDFLPRVNEINNELKLFTMFSITSERATCTLINAEKPDEQVTFESHIAHAKLQGGAAPIQELGSQHTYMRRYLYLMVYEISENDTLDPIIGDKPKEKEQEDVLIDNKKAYVLKQKAGVNIDAILSYYKVDSLEKLTVKQWSNAMKKLDEQKPQQ